MINGAHMVVYTENAEADRAFFRDVLGFRSVDVGGGWLVFALPPSEVGFHPAESNGKHEMHLMCDDLEAEMASLRSKGVETSDVSHESWGAVTKLRLPGGGRLSLYQPRHARP